MAATTSVMSEYKIFSVLSQYPLVSSSVNMVTNVYNRSKVYNRLTETTWGALENGVKFALGKTKPIVTSLEPKLHLVDDLAVKGLTAVRHRVDLVEAKSREALGTANSLIAVKISTVKAFGRQQYETLSNTTYATTVSTYAKSGLLAANSAIGSRLSQECLVPVPEASDLPTVLSLVLRNAVSYAGQVLSTPISGVKTYSADLSHKIGDSRLVKDLQSKVGALYHEITGDQKVSADAPMIEQTIVTYGRLLFAPFRRQLPLTDTVASSPTENTG